MNKVKSFVALWPVMVAVWLGLNLSLAYPVLITGAVVATILSVIFIVKYDTFDFVKVTPKAFLYQYIYILVFFIELFKSNVDVALRVISPRLRINPGIVEIKTRLKSDLGRLVLANSITLTPGTLTVDVVDDTLFIHWIDVTSENIVTATEKIASKFEKYLEVIYG